ncbi:O-antigen ligase family protein [Fodinicola feengrottensis]|uniref:O-antigen ligase family protein n=1 Tax=Fodinicola feengrottensis TaxID=435914 RepID=UPI0024430E2B|nr:O-antigen ligase family protein [Fodinicola feengrottensis]
MSRKWWLLFGFLAFGLSATQSRESTIGFVLGAAVMWWFRRGSVKPVVIAAVLVLGFAGLQVAIPKNQATVADRLAGVFNAIGGGKPKPSGKDDPAASRQETRIVFFKQGAGLLVRRPLLGYGVGQFGGTVASRTSTTRTGTTPW